jgi:hypothetical protein
MRSQLTSYIQKRLTRESEFWSVTPREFTTVGALKHILTQQAELMKHIHTYFPDINGDLPSTSSTPGSTSPVTRKGSVQIASQNFKSSIFSTLAVGKSTGLYSISERSPPTIYGQAPSFPAAVSDTGTWTEAKLTKDFAVEASPNSYLRTPGPSFLKKKSFSLEHSYAFLHCHCILHTCIY